MGTARERLREAKRIVVKVGTSTLTHETGKLNLHRIDLLLREKGAKEGDTIHIGEMEFEFRD